MLKGVEITSSSFLAGSKGSLLSEKKKYLLVYLEELTKPTL
jgi:hypothetical protein